jgi:predicted nucleic acid-binding protein
MGADSLADTNILVYACDPRFPAKREVARRLLRQGIVKSTIVIAHQSLIEFVSAVTRPGRGGPILPMEEARREAEEFLDAFQVLYPSEDILRTALRGVAAYRLSWYDAHLWAYAECNGISEILSEDFSHQQRYGRVRVVNPFLDGGAV